MPNAPQSPHRSLRPLGELAMALLVPALATPARAFDQDGHPCSRGSWVDTPGLALAVHGGSVPRMVKTLVAHSWSPFHGDLTEALRRRGLPLPTPVRP
jgi:hypothetical protein